MFGRDRGSGDCTRTRRSILATGTSLVATLAGCTRASEFLVDYYVGDVNVFNTVDRSITGSLTLVAPDGHLRLEESLDLAPGSGGEDDQEPETIYEDVLMAAGTYRLDLHVEATDATPERTTTEHLAVADPDDEYVVVIVGREFTDEFLTVVVVDDFAELDDVIDA